jgi:hypothetical protein
MTNTTLDYNKDVVNFLKMIEMLEKNTPYDFLYADEIVDMNEVDEFGTFRSIIVKFNSQNLVNVTKEQVYDLYEMFQSYKNNKITKQEKITLPKDMTLEDFEKICFDDNGMFVKNDALMQVVMKHKDCPNSLGFLYRNPNGLNNLLKKSRKQFKETGYIVFKAKQA